MFCLPAGTIQNCCLATFVTLLEAPSSGLVTCRVQYSLDMLKILCILLLRRAVSSVHSSGPGSRVYSWSGHKACIVGKTLCVPCPLLNLSALLVCCSVHVLFLLLSHDFIVTGNWYAMSRFRKFSSVPMHDLGLQLLQSQQF